MRRTGERAAASPELPEGAPRASAEARAEAARVGAFVALHARTMPDVPAVRAGETVRTFAEFSSDVNRLVRALRRRGVVAGDSVAVLGRNRIEFAATVMAALTAGLRFTPINWHLTPSEIAYVLTDCGAKALVADVIAGAASADAAEAAGTRVRLAFGGAIEGFERIEDAVAGESGAELPDPTLGTRMLYTSGTTGRPKGVVRPPNYSTNLEAITRAPAYVPGSGQLNLCTGPLHHGGPLSFSLMAPLAAGVGTVLMERWDADEALSLIDRLGITHTHMVPTMFQRLLRLPEARRQAADVSTLRYVLHGAAPCPVEVKQAMLAWFGPILWEYYASTEGAGSSCSPALAARKPGTVGTPPSPGHVVVLDERGAPCPPGVPGLVHLARGDADFVYWNDPHKTEAARRGGYFTVGDVGYLDADGDLFLTDRSDNLIVRGGVNVYPAEIEAVLVTHPAVRDAAVVGVPDEEWGELVRAVIECEAGVAADAALEASLLAFCRASLASYKCPAAVDFVEALPRQDNGKLYRGKVRARYRAGASR